MLIAHGLEEMLEALGVEEKDEYNVDQIRVRGDREEVQSGEHDEHGYSAKSECFFYIVW